MGAMNKLIWCAVCATEVGLPLTSRRGDGLASRWGLVGVPSTTCDHCLGRLVNGQIAVAISAYDEPDDYRPWEGELLSEMDADPLDEIAGVGRE